jgi:thioredoxin-related protein
MKKIIFVFAFIPFLAQAQTEPAAGDTGIHFEHNLSWVAVQAKAKKEHKYIFMDCYTTWCGPCRYMSTTIFPKEETGNYFNDKFVSVAVQLDTTSKDAEAVKAWYRDGHDIAAKYHVRAYPTYLIFAPDGKIIHRLVGSRLDAKTFIADMGSSFDSTMQYYTLLDEYNKGRRDTAFLHKVAMAAFSAYDGENGKKIADEYLATQSDLLNRDDLYLAFQYTNKSSDNYFSVFVDHAAEVDKILGPKAAEMKVRNVYMTEGADLKPGDNRLPDWAAVQAKIATKLPAEADELTARVKVNYYRSKKDWVNFETAIVAYMKTYGDHMTDAELNDVAWSVFQGCPDMTCVSEVLDWSKRLKDGGDAAFMDTYANILYKLGKKDDAIALETKAIGMLPDADKGTYQETLTKMKNGEKTW